MKKCVCVGGNAINAQMPHTLSPRSYARPPQHLSVHVHTSTRHVALLTEEDQEGRKQGPELVNRLDGDLLLLDGGLQHCHAGEVGGTLESTRRGRMGEAAGAECE